jgi:hypothetical protein
MQHLTCNREPYAVACYMTIEPRERVEDMFTRAFRYTGSIVFHKDLDIAVSHG